MAPSHEAAVTQISAAVRAFFTRRESFRVFHGSTNSTRPGHTGRVVDISALSNVLEIDQTSKTAVVEPNVPMDKLVQATLAHGLIPPVVMEFPGITVGGGFAGSAGESSSYKYGYFDQTVKGVEVVLASGEVVKASATEKPDLFKAAAGTAGTLGITTKLELGLIPACRFVKLAYHPYSSVRETVEAVKRETENPENHYVDGILFSKTHGVVMTGKLTDEIPPSQKPQTFSGSWDPWFYLHAEKKSLQSRTSDPTVDHIPIAEYLFRYDRGGFWVGAEAFKYFGNMIPFNKFTRWFLDDFMHTRMLYRALQGSDMSFGTMVQDLSLPYDTAEAFIDYTDEQLGIWPLWLCPLRGVSPPTFHPFHQSEEGKPQPMLNIGLWGAASKDLSTFINQNRDLEARLKELGGRKVLYSHTYYTEDEFWALYDKKWYDGLRESYSATTLPSIYDKVHVDVDKVQNEQKERLGRSWISWLMTCWPFPGIMGIRNAIRSGDYLIHRQPSWTYWKMGSLLTAQKVDGKKVVPVTATTTTTATATRVEIGGS
ncbi:hypothetical protein B0H66DRAFT_478479 [Apodospora peruviana]|uniref:Delta(24)-sterol reductase n=1 Tax=Apodospora peruviana TaxID=516989 RepID=A0AAE0M2S2_9PEZI|nr:hypothetical protein B0H66DRAFT_478479 [Apodospora peruviana]